MPELVGLLLAAGRGRRFDAEGRRHKLLEPLPSGLLVVEAAAQALLSSAARVLALLPADERPHTQALSQRLAQVGCQIHHCADADLGMGHTLAAGVSASKGAMGWLVLPGDMPWVRPATCRQVAAALVGGAVCAAPVFEGQRGHPVGFGEACLTALCALQGDIGARSILAEFPPWLIETDDAGVLADVDTEVALRVGLPRP
jgi:molybdenum cofactor cytidylyltransferase